MDGYRISEAARVTGFTSSALRFYEREGVVVPERSPAGYRRYRENHVDALRFVARGKQLGMSLDDITELLALIDDDQCAPVQSRIRHIVGERIALAKEQISELMALTAQLREAAARLEVHTPEGACDDTCGCRSEPAQPRTAEDDDRTSLFGSRSGPVACSLGPGMVGPRIEDWNRLLTSATSGDRVPGGLRVTFDGSVDVARLAELAAAEQTCCPFFAFAIGIGADGVSLEVTGPSDSQEIIDAVFGAVA